MPGPAPETGDPSAQVQMTTWGHKQAGASAGGPAPSPCPLCHWPLHVQGECCLLQAKNQGRDCLCLQVGLGGDESEG